MAALRIFVMAFLATSLIPVSGGLAQQSQVTTPETPADLVATYDNLAMAILAVKNTEENLVRSILSTSYAHANAAFARVRQAEKSGNSEVARAAVKELATHVAQLATEGDNAVAGIRKRLVEGGHHHNALGESQGIYDPGFVVVTKEAKRQLLQASREIAQLSNSPDAQALTKTWENVQKIWNGLAEKK